MPTVELTYFALFRERAGVANERRTTEASTVGDLYLELQPTLGLDPSLVRAAVDGEFVPNDHPLVDGSAVVFVPPVAGG